MEIMGKSGFTRQNNFDMRFNIDTQRAFRLYRVKMLTDRPMREAATQ